LVLRYGQLREVSRTVKICNNFPAMGHSAGFGYTLWAAAQDLIMRHCANHLAERRNTQQFVKSLPHPLNELR
jgi:hypothetical protein